MATVTPNFSISKMQWSLLLDQTCEKINNLGNCVVSKLTSLSTQQPMLGNALKVMEENKETIDKMSLEEKEDLISQREKDLWQKVKSGGTTAFALIFGISIGS